MFDEHDTGNLLEADSGGVPARRNHAEDGASPPTSGRTFHDDEVT